MKITPFLEFKNLQGSIQYDWFNDENRVRLYDVATINVDFLESDTKIDFREIEFVPSTGTNDFEKESEYYSTTNSL